MPPNARLASANNRSASSEGSPQAWAAPRARTSAAVALETSRMSKWGEDAAAHQRSPPSRWSSSCRAARYSAKQPARSHLRRSATLRAKLRGRQIAPATPVALSASKNGRPKTRFAASRAASTGARGTSSSAEMSTARSTMASLSGEVGTWWMRSVR
eukprot:scaffold23251_cov90-Isochrysis_galbana.AAC.1